MAVICKTCKHCNESKTIEAFGIRNYHNRSVARTYCKVCEVKMANATMLKKKEYYDQKRKEYRTKNVGKRNEYMRQWHKDNKEYSAAQNKLWHQSNYKTNIQYTLATNLRNRITDALDGKWKNGSAVRDLGCSIEELKKHLESKFQSGMTWGNWSKYGWHIDHIKPLCSFDLQDTKQFKQACHYTNLQPLWAIDNLRKGGR